MRNRYTQLVCWIVVLIVIALMVDFTLAQETNGPSSTNSVPPFDPATFPVGKEQMWLALIPPITALLTWLIGKIPPIPPQILPFVVPFIGIALGQILKYAEGANWSWYWSAGAGAIATWIYQAAKELTSRSPTAQKVIMPTDPSKVEPRAINTLP